MHNYTVLVVGIPRLVFGANMPKLREVIAITTETHLGIRVDNEEVGLYASVQTTPEPVRVIVYGDVQITKPTQSELNTFLKAQLKEKNINFDGEVTWEAHNPSAVIQAA